jgi:hypothetical protein
VSTLSSWPACHNAEQGDYYSHGKCNGDQTFLGETKIHDFTGPWFLIRLIELELGYSE